MKKVLVLCGTVAGAAGIARADTVLTFGPEAAQIAASPNPFDPEENPINQNYGAYVSNNTDALGLAYGSLSNTPDVRVNYTPIAGQYDPNLSVQGALGIHVAGPTYSGAYGSVGDFSTFIYDAYGLNVGDPTTAQDPTSSDPRWDLTFTGTASHPVTVNSFQMVCQDQTPGASANEEIKVFLDGSATAAYDSFVTLPGSDPSNPLTHLTITLPAGIATGTTVDIELIDPSNETYNTALSNVSFSEGNAPIVWNNSLGATGDGAIWDGSQQNFNTDGGPTTFAGNDVIFNDVNNGHYSVTLNTSVTPNSVIVNNSAGDYTISGSGHINGSGALTKLGSSKLTLNTTNGYTGGTNVLGGTLVAGVAGALPDAPVSVGASALLQLANGIGMTTIQTLTIDPAGTVDLTNGGFVITGTPLATIQGYVAAGVGGSFGIISSILVDTHHGIGAIDNGAGGTIVRYTLLGDTDLSGSINFNDLLTLAQHYGQSNVGWAQGDTDGNGSINFNDLLSLAQNYGQSVPVGSPELSPSFAAEWNLAVAEASAVPEPASFGLLAIGAMGLLARRRRNVSPR